MHSKGDFRQGFRVQGPLDEGARPKSGNLRLNLHGTCFGGKINWFGPKKQCQKESF
jgi:hypothetical protein